MIRKKKAPKGWICLTEFGKLTGISTKTITAAIRNGKIPETFAARIGKAATAPYYLEPEKSAQSWYNSISPKKPHSNKVRLQLKDYIKTFVPETVTDEVKGEPEELTLAELQKREQKAKTETAELKLEQLKGSYVSKADIDNQLYNAGKEIRDAILSVPNRIADQVIAYCDNRTMVVNIMTDALRDELKRLAELIQQE